MIRVVLFVFLILLSGRLFAQQPPPQQQNRPKPGVQLPPPLALREVSGIVKDQKGVTVIGATVSLVSKKDTIQSSTNEDGIFIFKNVKLATFVITVKSIGYETTIRKYLNNDVVKRIILDPIELKSENNQLKEVVINGTPSIVYKTDTIEYKASDYKVRENATLDELLKKMEGMEVGSDGTLTHQGQQVMKARVNGKDFAGGDVAQAIQNLPADIVEKIQVVDDYGDQAGRTGIKDGDPTKVLNITTRADRSVGNILRLTASDGNDGRYDERLFSQRLDGNEQLGIIGNIRNTVNGVASSGISAGGLASGSSGGSGGTTTSGGPSFNYRDQWSKAIQVNFNYRYTFSDVNSINNSTGQFVSTIRDSLTHQLIATPPSATANNSTGTNNNKTHNASFEFEYTPDSANFLRVTPSFSYTGTTNSNNYQQSYVGYKNQLANGITSSNNTTPSYGAIILYQYIFKKPKRNISIQLNANNGNQQQNTEQNTQTFNKDTSQNVVSTILNHTTVMRGNITKDYRASLTYVEPITTISQLEFHAQTEYRDYNNTTVTDSIAPNGNVTQLFNQSNIYTYSFTNSRISLNYRLTKPKFNISLGAMAIPSHLSGSDLSSPVTTNRNDFYLVPLFRFQYQWSRTHQISINYTGAPTEPSFTQIQPVPDVTNPNNIVFGNPDLSPSFKHTITTRYNNYLPNDKVNLSANIVYSLYDSQILNNSVTLITPVTIAGKTTTLSTLQTYFVNLSGTNSLLANYNISKQSNDRAYNFALNGTINYMYQLAENNGVVQHLTTWDINERFGPRIDPNTSLEINPFVSYDINRSFNTIPGSTATDIKRTAMNLEGKFYLGKDRTWTIEYDLSKNYINGLASNITKNPFVANAYIEKEFFKRKNGILRISAFDIFDQNNFINHVVTNNGYTDTKSNALSRYVLVSFVLNLQKWTGTPSRNGKQMNRRGDGSFIYN
jgi:hypothetical protein